MLITKEKVKTIRDNSDPPLKSGTYGVVEAYVSGKNGYYAIVRLATNRLVPINISDLEIVSDKEFLEKFRSK